MAIHVKGDIFVIEHIWDLMVHLYPGQISYNCWWGWVGEWSALQMYMSKTADTWFLHVNFDFMKVTLTRHWWPPPTLGWCVLICILLNLKSFVFLPPPFFLSPKPFDCHGFLLELQLLCFSVADKNKLSSRFYHMFLCNVSFQTCLIFTIYS